MSEEYFLCENCGKIYSGYSECKYCHGEPLTPYEASKRIAEAYQEGYEDGYNEGRESVNSEIVEKSFEDGYNEGRESVNTGCENCGSNGSYCKLCNKDEWKHCTGCGEMIATETNKEAHPRDCGNGLCPECEYGPEPQMGGNRDGI